jgi:hypothetical protein
VEYTLERYFADKFYFLATGALFQSTYTSLEGKTRNTKFNSNYAFNFLAGKEFNVGKSSRGNVLAFNFKFFFNGGRRYIPVDLAASKLAGKTVFDYSRAWDNKLDNLTQLNFSCSYRVNRAKTSHEFILDVVNLTGENSRFSEHYNKYTGTLDYYRQMNRLPNIMYRIHF